jgi:N4-gp56 family major capsid protein
MSSNVYANGTSTATVGGVMQNGADKGSAKGNTIVHFYDRAGVKAANRVNLYGQFADRKSMPKKMGKNFKISKFLHMYDRSLNHADFSGKGFLTARSIDEITTALDSAATLGEGALAVNKRTLHKVTMETSLARYGEMLDYTDEVELFSEDSMQVRYREELGELANSRYEDLLQRDMLSTGTVMFGGSATTEIECDEDSEVNYDLIRKGVRKLVRNRAKKNSSIVTGDVKIDTRTIAKSYYAIIGANVKGSLETITRGTGSTEEFVFIPVHKYASAATLAEAEVGAMHEIRFLESEAAVVYNAQGAVPPQNYAGDLSISSDSAIDLTSGTAGDRGNFDIFPILFPTEGSFATVGLKGQGKMKFNSRSPEFVTNENPYGTTGFFSYNFFYAAIILQEEKLLKMMVTAVA